MANVKVSELSCQGIRGQDLMLLSCYCGGVYTYSTNVPVEDVKNYIIEKKYLVDAEAFVAFYSSKGWKVGNSPMKDWKMALVTWTKRDSRNIQQGYGKIPQPSLNVNEKWKR